MNSTNQSRQTTRRADLSTQAGDRTSHAPSVLIIDDDNDLTDALRANLHLHGYIVHTANRAVEGLRTVMEWDFDAIICDMVMPRLRGDMFYLAVSKVKPHLCERFIFCTGYGSEPSIAAFLFAAQRPVLHKPVKISDLLEVLSAVIQKRGPHFSLVDLQRTASPCFV